MYDFKFSVPKSVKQNDEEEETKNGRYSLTDWY